MSTGPGAWREAWREVTGEWRELAADMREQRQITRRMWQRITGKPDPTRRERRHAERVITVETKELQEIERRVLREHRKNEGPEAPGRNPS